MRARTMLTLDYIESESILRLSGFTPADARRLMDACLALSQNQASHALHTQPWVRALDGVTLTMRVKTWNQDVLTVGPRAFEWSLTAGAWDNVAGLIEPFCESASNGFQWLNQASGDAEVLLSPQGDW
ncbi:MAG: hypothetical protein JNM94_07975 [Phycisphaerae bacterium]|nr:hypothetical protein [Phycisphaerae bacterium]